MAGDYGSTASSAPPANQNDVYFTAGQTGVITSTNGCMLSETFDIHVKPVEALKGSVSPATQACGSNVTYTVEVGDSYFDIGVM